MLNIQSEAARANVYNSLHNASDVSCLCPVYKRVSSCSDWLAGDEHCYVLLQIVVIGLNAVIGLITVIDLIAVFGLIAVMS